MPLSPAPAWLVIDASMASRPEVSVSPLSVGLLTTACKCAILRSSMPSSASRLGFIWLRVASPPLIFSLLSSPSPPRLHAAHTQKPAHDGHTQAAEGAATSGLYERLRQLRQYFFRQRRLRTPFSAAEVQNSSREASLAVLHWWQLLPLVEEEGEESGWREGDVWEWGESGLASSLPCASSAAAEWEEDWWWHEVEEEEVSAPGALSGGGGRWWLVVSSSALLAVREEENPRWKDGGVDSFRSPTRAVSAHAIEQARAAMQEREQGRGEGTEQGRQEVETVPTGGGGRGGDEMRS